MKECLSIMIVDDHRLVCEAVFSYLTRIDGFTAQYCWGFDEAVTTLTQSGPFNVILLDLNMPGMNGMKGVGEIVQLNEGGNVVLFSGRACPQNLKVALDLGCKGLIPKDLPLVSLESAIRLVATGEIFVRFSSADTDVSQIVPNNLLNEREITIVRMVSEGKTNKEIAWSLNISEITVKAEMRRICITLDALNRAHAVTRARELGLI